jgi:hypothetical protein
LSGCNSLHFSKKTFRACSAELVRLMPSASYGFVSSSSSLTVVAVVLVVIADRCICLWRRERREIRDLPQQRAFDVLRNKKISSVFFSLLVLLDF